MDETADSCSKSGIRWSPIGLVAKQSEGAMMDETAVSCSKSGICCRPTGSEKAYCNWDRSEKDDRLYASFDAVFNTPPDGRGSYEGCIVFYLNPVFRF